ncbi:hypothetical protein Daus18300_013640 [Diaporthe australafricana]|uniref:DUF7730 domain-containing protein n=1 Tax=Diaporthe australafricana TaxID=127596 RepID=A0ABR3VYC1_9PEZI
MAAAYQQGSSSFFQKLPPEIRLEVYSQLFCSTRLSFGRPLRLSRHKRSRILIRPARIRPAPNSLSLLRVCRRVNDEIEDSWLGQVLFSFEDPETMLEKLTALKAQTLGKLRHMRYSGEGRLVLRIRAPDGDLDPGEQCEYGLCEILKSLPGLCLDRLTVLGEPTAQRRYGDLDHLIKHSDGWKELCYVSSDSVMLGFRKFQGNFVHWDPPLRAPQPSTWIQALISRDGPTASVTIYRSSDANARGSMISKPATCRAFADQAAEPGKESQYGVELDNALMTPAEKKKEMLVVVRRGKGVDCTENGTSPMMKHDIRKNWPGMPWDQIRSMSFDWYSEFMGRRVFPEDPMTILFQWLYFGFIPHRLRQHDGPPSNGESTGIETDEHSYLITVDSYEHVNDYEWGPCHTIIGPNLHNL